MAAVGGVLSRSQAPAAEALERLLAAAPHRGARIDVASLGAAALGIANIDGRPDATLAEDGTLAVAFTGTLDNLEHVVHVAGARGDATRSTPAQAVLDGFRAMGDRLPAILRGDFACVVTDGSCLWCFRDQIGFETLFYREDPDGVYVATEAKQVLAGAGVSPEPDLEIVEAIFFGDQYDPERCALQGVSRLLTATILEADARSRSERRYWNPTQLLETARLTPDEVVARFRELFEQSVRRRLTGRDAVALSGGIDSPPIAAFAAPDHLQRFGRPIAAVAELYPSYPSCDETPYIELVAGELRIPLHTYEPGRQRLDRLQDWVRLFDGPWTTTAPEGTAARCRHARSHGFDTILTGHYAEHVTAAGQVALVPHLLWRGRVRAAAAYLASERGAGVGWRRLAQQVVYTLAPRALVAHRNRRRPLLPMPPWLDPHRIGERDAKVTLPPRQWWTEHQLPFFGASANGEADLFSHAVHGVRPRRPWADVDLWEFFISLPAEVKFPDYRMKGFLRNVLRGDVPDAILDRRDKTNTNEYVSKMCLDYPAIQHWVSKPGYRMKGVDYGLLTEHLERANMSLAHYMWAKDLAAVHAFLDLWENPTSAVADKTW